MILNSYEPRHFLYLLAVYIINNYILNKTYLPEARKFFASLFMVHMSRIDVVYQASEVITFLIAICPSK